MQSLGASLSSYVIRWFANAGLCTNFVAFMWLLVFVLLVPTGVSCGAEIGDRVVAGTDGSVCSGHLLDEGRLGRGTVLPLSISRDTATTAAVDELQRTKIAQAPDRVPERRPIVKQTPQADVVTQGNGNFRTGAFTAEKTLTPDLVAGDRFGRLYVRHVRGQLFAQPLYARGIETPKGVKNLLVVATGANMVYLFDADYTGASDSRALVAKRQLAESAALDTAAQNTDHGICEQTTPSYFGITSTPVIDLRTNTLYVVVYDTAPYQSVTPIPLLKRGRYFIHALDLSRNLLPKTHPVEIAAPGFDPHRGRNRPGLLLMNGVVYVAFGSFICDHPLDYSGWVFGFRARDLTKAGVFRTDPTLHGAGIWQSGRGLVGDGRYVYFMTGNENAAVPRPDTIANSFVKLDTQGGMLTLAKKFTPSNSAQLSLGDADLGSSGPLVLPNGRLIGAGKQGRVYVLDSNTMTLSQNTSEADGFEGFQGFRNTYHDNPDKTHCAPNADEICRKILPGYFPFPTGTPGAYSEASSITDGCKGPQADPPKEQRCMIVRNVRQQPDCYLPVACYQFDQHFGPNLHAGFVYWDRAPSLNEGRLFALAEKDNLKAFRYDLTTSRVEETPVAVNSVIRAPNGMPGGALSLSANGNRNGILWVSIHEDDAMGGIHPGHFYAVDATSLKKLWHDPQPIEYFAKFNPPIIADGKVFLATWGMPPKLNQQNGLDARKQVDSAVIAYGLSPRSMRHESWLHPFGQESGRR